MDGAFYIGATGLRSQEEALDVIANNIANINTPAFKRSQINFAEMVTPRDDQTDVSPAAGNGVFGLSGVAMDSSSKVFTQGDLRQTGQSMDLAISGSGFMELLGPGGQTMLWRGGTLKVNADGYLAASNGMPLKAMISVPSDITALTIDPDGKVHATTGANGQVSDIGQIDLATPKDMSSLAAVGDGLYAAADDSEITTAAPGEDNGGTLTQGAIEGSNVQLSDEMVLLLLLQRAYSANAQVLQAGDQLMSIANSLKR